MAAQKRRATVEERRRFFKTIPIDFSRGQWGAADPAFMPDGFCRKLRNVLFRASSPEKRPPFTYDNLTTIHSLALWDDAANKVTRLVSVDGSGNLKAKNTSGETWGSAASGTVSGSRLSSFATYQGILYGMMHDSNGLPSAAFSYDGTTVDTTPFQSSIQARSVVAYKERLYFLYPRVTVTNLVGTTHAYDFGISDGGSTSSTWTATNVNRSVISQSGALIRRISPTSTGASACSISGLNSTNTAGILGIASLTVDTPYVLRQGLSPVHATYRVPMTVEIKINNRPAIDPQAWVVNDIITGGGYYHRCVTAGNTTGADPVWATTGGAITTWGTADFRNEGADVLASTEFDLPNATELSTPYWVYLPFTIPRNATGLTAYPVYKFYNSGSSALTTLASVDFSLQDGLSDADIKKNNYGLQITQGDFHYPFFNKQSSATATIDLDEWMWSEIAEPTRIRRTNSLSTSGPVGYGQAACVLGGRLVGFKRRFRMALGANGGSSAADIPVIPETEWMQGGCIGPRAVDVFQDEDGSETAYYIGEDEIFAWQYGSNPVRLCGDAMVDEIMDKSSATWVEAQTYNMPLLKVDQKRRHVWVYTQKGKLFCYDIDRKAWTIHDAGGDASVSPTGYEIYDLMYYPGTGHMYVAFATAGAGTAGLARLDATQADALDQISSSGTLTVHAEIWPRPFKPNADIRIQDLRFDHAITTDQTGQTTTAGVSFDQGLTFTKTNQIVVSPLSSGEYVPITIPLWQSGPSLQPRIIHSGKGGSGSFNVSAINVDIKILRPETYPLTTPTQGSASL